jgi:S1-C subfamily serine protease
MPDQPDILARKLTAMLLVAALALLGGCAASTQLVTNPKASDKVMAKSFKTYREVLFLPPKADPRKLVPRVVGEIEQMGFKVTLLDPNKPVEPAQGTGFVIGADGWLLTCAHVVGEQKEATVTLAGKRILADVTKADAKADLALLKLREPLPAEAGVLAFRVAARPAAMGEDVFTIGYPLSRMLGNSARMSKGLLSATAGLRDNANELQVSAEIHPGNSGGPLLDREGQVIGVVNKTINPAAVAQATGGALPQNINFAIKAVPVLDFVKASEPALHGALAFDRAGGLDQAGKAVAKVQAGNAPPDSQRADKMVVRFQYISLWDMWYRFRLFVLAAFDYETQEPLFIAGQGRDNIVSNEDVVVRDTLDQFRKAISAR